MTTSEIHVRIATQHDAHAIADLNTLFNGFYLDPAMLAERLANPSLADQALIATMQDQAVGFAVLRIVPCLLYERPYGELTELYVIEAQRRRGVARALLEYAETLAKQRNVKELRILTGEENVTAQAFYAAHGYEHDDLALSKIL